MYTCQYCAEIFDKKDLTLDHVIPKSKKGPSNWENVVTACKACNLKKQINPAHPLRNPSSLPLARCSMVIHLTAIHSLIRNGQNISFSRSYI